MVSVPRGRGNVLAVALALGACGGGGGPDAVDAMDAIAEDTAPPCPIDDAGTPVTFDTVYAQIVSQHCGAPSSCHFNAAMPTAGLDMSTMAAARTNLVNTPAATAGFCMPSNVMFRVAPGDPDHSMIWRRVSGRTCAEQMPLGGPYLSCDDRNLIRNWIASGAR